MQCNMMTQIVKLTSKIKLSYNDHKMKRQIFRNSPFALLQNPLHQVTTKFWPLKWPENPKMKNWLGYTNNKKIIFNLYPTHVNKQDLIKYYYQCLSSSTKSTWITAINNCNFSGQQGLSANAVWQHLPISTVTIKGHNKQSLQNMISTTKMKHHQCVWVTFSDFLLSLVLFQFFVLICFLILV